MTGITDLQDYTFTAKYAQHLKKEKRRETWNESVDRNKNMQKKYYSFAKIDNIIDEAYEDLRAQIVLGSQRNLQFAGPAVEQKHARSYNCTASYCDRLRFFGEAMYLLLCGCGTGFSVQKHHIAKLPELDLTPKTINRKYVIPDTIEGWADAISVLLSSYFKNPLFPEYSNCHVEFDYSLIRPKGSSFSHGIGRAPGPDGLKNSIEKIRSLLNKCLDEKLNCIRPIHAYDITMHISDAVLSGGIRRSATICIFSPDDDEMMSAKTGNWYIENPQRGRSNNSAILLRGKTSREIFDKLIKFTKEFGEPGFYWSDSLEFIPNPCVEQTFYCYDSEGNSGWQGCNLTSTNGKKIKTKQDLFRAIKSATVIGTLQAGWTNFDYLGKVSEEIFRREALLGVSINGFMENPKILLDPDILREGANYAKEVNAEIAKLIGINRAARITCVKPEGTSSCLLGSSSGIHPHHAKKFIRRVQANKTEGPVKFYQHLNPHAVEESVWSTNKTDLSISFACEINNSGAIFKEDISGLDLLEKVKLVQINWVTEGRNKELCTDPLLNNNVSNTIHVKDNEWESIGNYIFENQEYFTGVSLISSTGDKDYSQAPFLKIYSPQEIIDIYGEGSLFASGLIDEALEIYGDLWVACNDILYNIDSLQNKESIEHKENLRLRKVNWIGRIQKFSKKYLGGDLKNTTYLMKDVYSWKFWLDLKKKHKSVDYTKMQEIENTTLGSQVVACAGGTCEIL